MKQNLPRSGFGFAIVLAGLTLAVAVVSGLFLVFESGTAPAPLEFTPPPAVAEMHTPKAPQADHSRARHPRVARLPRVHHRVPA
jgi:hypothetical protein